MTNKLVVIINSLKVPKIKKILLYEMKFLVPNYSCLQNPWLRGYRPQIPVLSVVCPQLNLLNPPPPEQNPWIRHCFWIACLRTEIQALGPPPRIRRSNDSHHPKIRSTPWRLYSHFWAQNVLFFKADRRLVTSSPHPDVTACCQPSVSLLILKTSSSSSIRGT